MYCCVKVIKFSLILRELIRYELYTFIDTLENNVWSSEELEKVLLECRFSVEEAKTLYLDSVSALDSVLQFGQSSLQISFIMEANTVLHIMSERVYETEKLSTIEDIKKIENKSSYLLTTTLEKFGFCKCIRFCSSSWSIVITNFVYYGS
ncbi:uncharacterized protein LOC126906044 [Daktulosphaira vitifoliae]|uniref:uncharacterized protein LOC126906044 n=1 Tax=Daktulosphaira vitifoliae TaxID=58002 RepID=UPI0021A98104|nr:uncharacterized protein LOC126906044 [Daktulosphaira vitifoliae]